MGRKVLLISRHATAKTIAVKDRELVHLLIKKFLQSYV